MPFELIISKIAAIETNKAYLFYEDSSEGLGEKFLRALEEVYTKISNNPTYYGYINKARDLRDVRIKGFPFVAIFQKINDQIFVLSIFNTSRNPNFT